MAERSFLGVGWQFPVGISTGRERVARVAVSAYEKSVAESIRIVLGTAPGERLMRPDFGCDLNRLAFAPNTTATAGMAIFYVREALNNWEPRIELLGVDAEADPDSAETLLIHIDYRIRATNAVQNLVYPYYLGRV